MYCRRCGTLLPQGVVICPECGTRQRRQAVSVRCANCRGRVPVGLTVCPHCGRDVRPAGPRWGLWLAGLVLLILFGLWGLGRLPLEQAGQEIARVRSKLTGLVQVLGPVIRPMQPLETPQVAGLLTRVPTPTATEPELSPADEAAPLPDEAAPIDEETPADEAPTDEATAVMTDTVTATTAITATGTITANGTGVTTATPAPTATATAVPTAKPTLAPTAVPPTATSTATKAVPAQATPASGNQTTYVIQAGDTLSVIAGRFKVSLDVLLAANQLTAKSVLRIGQQLIIPVSGAPIPPSATPPPKRRRRSLQHCSRLRQRRYWRRRVKRAPVIRRPTLATGERFIWFGNLCQAWCLAINTWCAFAGSRTARPIELPTAHHCYYDPGAPMAVESGRPARP